MRGADVIAVRADNGGNVQWRAEQVYGGLFCSGPDPAELRAWVADDLELGRRVADEFVGTGRCLRGTLDQCFVEEQQREFPAAEDPEKRKAGLAKASLCQEDAHYRPTAAGGGLVHCAPPAGEPLNGLFWTACITH